MIKVGDDLLCVSCVETGLLLFPGLIETGNRHASASPKGGFKEHSGMEIKGVGQ